jgi:hypothetical protein
MYAVQRDTVDKVGLVGSPTEFHAIWSLDGAKKLLAATS